MNRLINGCKLFATLILVAFSHVANAQAVLQPQFAPWMPASACGFSNYDSVKFEVENVGSASSVGFAASYKWANQSWHTEIFNQPLAPQQSAAFKFQQGVWVQHSADTLWLAVRDLQSNTVDTVFRVTQPALAVELPLVESFPMGQASPNYCLAVGAAVLADFWGMSASLPQYQSNILVLAAHPQANVPFDTAVPADVWAPHWNPEHLAVLSFRVEPGQTDSLRLQFKLKQLASSLSPLQSMCYFRVLVNGQQLGPTLQPTAISTPLSGAFATLDYDLQALASAGGPLLITFESKVRLPASLPGGFNGNLIDDVLVYNRQAHGIQLLEVKSVPPFPVAGEPVRVQVRLRNTGQLPVQQLQLSHDLGPNLTSQLFSLNLSFLRDTVLLFGASVPARSGQYGVQSGAVNGQNIPADTLYQQLDLLQEVISLPYCDDFEQGVGAWKQAHAYSAERGGAWTHGAPNKGFLNAPYAGSGAWYLGADSTYAAFDSSALHLPAFQVEQDSCYRVRFMANWLFDYYNNQISSMPILGDGFTLEYSSDGIWWDNLGEIDTTLPNKWFNARVFALRDFRFMPSGRNRGWTMKSDGFLLQEQVFKATHTGKLYLRFRSGSDDVFEGEGVVIDDFCFEKADCSALPTSLKPTAVPNQWRLYPNPTSHGSRLEVEVHHATTLHWRLFDLRGAQLEQAQMAVEAGRHQEELDLRHLQPGMYVLQVQLGAELQHFRLVKQ